MKTAFSAQQKRVLTLCVILYTSAYVCRLNLSAALGSMMADLHLSMARGGMLQTMFAAIYAAGQFVNGAIVDRVNPARYMLLGLAGSAACNIAMGFGHSFAMLLAVWSLNAVFQSMMWTPVMRLLALYFLDAPVRERANETVALMLIAGHFIAWAISGFVSAASIWRYSFILPGMISAAAIAVMARTALTLDVRRQETHKKALVPTGEPIMRVLLATGFFLVLVTCVLYGFIRDSVITWTPTILLRQSDAVSGAAFTLILPAINMAGVLLGFRLRRRGARPHGVVAVMMAGAILCSAVLMKRFGLPATAVLLGMICAGMYGANTMLTGLIPLEYDRVGRTSLTAGMIDSFIYLGSALSGAIAGGIYETLGPDMLYGAWMLAGGVSALLMMISSRMSAAFWQKTAKK
ncbi:MAG: MFS transporter [Clostridia bacterium]|nr:MFS transporter [Clostridia bacterium]